MVLCWRERSEHALYGRSLGGPDRREVGLESLDIFVRHVTVMSNEICADSRIWLFKKH